MRRHGGGTGGVPCFAGAGGAHSFAAFAAGRVLAAGGFQLRAHSAGFWAGRGRKHRAGCGRTGVAHGRCAACSGAAAGQSHAGGKLYHSGACVGAGGIAFGAHQLFNGAARAVRCGAHRHPERRPTAIGDDEGVSPSAGPTAAGGVAACGAAGLPAGMQRGPWHLLEERRCR